MTNPRVEWGQLRATPGLVGDQLFNRKKTRKSSNLDMQLLIAEESYGRFAFIALIPTT